MREGRVVRGQMQASEEFGTVQDTGSLWDLVKEDLD